MHSESLEEYTLFNVLIYCVPIAKFYICEWIHNDNAINLFQYLIELK